MSACGFILRRYRFWKASGIWWKPATFPAVFTATGISASHQIEKAPSCPDWIFDVCFDPQTAGGLFFSLPAAKAQSLVETMRAAGIADAAIVGDVTSEHPGKIFME